VWRPYRGRRHARVVALSSFDFTGAGTAFLEPRTRQVGSSSLPHQQSSRSYRERRSPGSDDGSEFGMGRAPSNGARARRRTPSRSTTRAPSVRYAKSSSAEELVFYGSDTHAESAAAIFSVIASWQLHGIDLHQYLAEVLRVLPYWPKESGTSSSLRRTGWPPAPSSAPTSSPRRSARSPSRQRDGSAGPQPWVGASWKVGFVDRVPLKRNASPCRVRRHVPRWACRQGVAIRSEWLPMPHELATV
jgi:hypothetical protein